MVKENYINTKKLNESTVNILENISSISQEIKSCEITTNKIIEYCKELDSYDGRKIIFSTDIPTLDLNTSDEWYRLYILGHEELIEYTINVQKKLEDIQHIMNSVFDKIKTIDNFSDTIDSQIRKIEDILVNGVEAGTAVAGINNISETTFQNIDGNMITNETFIDSVQTNFENNKILTNQMNQEIYKGVFEKMKEFSSNYRGGNS